MCLESFHSDSELLVYTALNLHKTKQFMALWLSVQGCMALVHFLLLNMYVLPVAVTCRIGKGQNHQRP